MLSVKSRKIWSLSGCLTELQELKVISAKIQLKNDDVKAEGKDKERYENEMDVTKKRIFSLFVCHSRQVMRTTLTPRQQTKIEMHFFETTCTLALVKRQSPKTKVAGE